MIQTPFDAIQKYSLASRRQGRNVLIEF